MSIFADAAGEIAVVCDAIDDGQIETVCARLSEARHIMAYGCGREALQLRGFVMRLHHLGRSVSMQGDMAAPPLGPSDVFLASAGPGDLSTATALMQTARAAGAHVILLTGEPDAAPCKLAHDLLVIPAQTMARDQSAPTSTLPMGSVFEGAMFLLFEILVLRLRDRLGQTPEAMRARRTNM